MKSMIVLIVIFVLIGLAVWFICQNGGWQGGCGGNCAHCHQRCADAGKKQPDKAAATPPETTDAAPKK